MKTIIGFLTDWGIKDGAVATCKSIMKSIFRKIEIIDISHDVNSIPEGAFVLATSYKWFPKESIFLAVVDPGVGTLRKIIIVKTKKYLFVAPDNGILSFIPKEKIEKVVEVKNDLYFIHPVSTVFHGRDIFSPVTGYLAKKMNIENFGDLIDKQTLTKITLFKLTYDQKRMSGRVTFIDDFGNLITNITRKKFFEFVNYSKFKIKVGDKEINYLSENFAEGEKEEFIVLFGGDFRLGGTGQEHDLLSIAINQENAAEKLGLSIGDEVVVSKYK